MANSHLPQQCLSEASRERKSESGKGGELGNNTGEARICLPMEISLEPQQGHAVLSAFREGAVAQPCDHPAPLPFPYGFAPQRYLDSEWAA